MDFDVIVIGSGFGGAITGCRLAQKNKKVLILERGKEWTKDTYPRNIEDEWIWSNTSPEKYHGWTDLRTFKGMAVITGAGVGGGSLIYANVSAIPPKSVFQAGHPKLPTTRCNLTTPPSGMFSTCKRFRQSSAAHASN